MHFFSFGDKASGERTLHGLEHLIKCTMHVCKLKPQT